MMRNTITLTCDFCTANILSNLSKKALKSCIKKHKKELIDKEIDS